MLDVARVLIDRNEPFNGNIIFCEQGQGSANVQYGTALKVRLMLRLGSLSETLQDGSHLYSTQHETAKE